MRIKALNINNPSFGIMTKPPRRDKYALIAGMIILRKTGLWIKTKIKYMLHDKKMVEWNYLKDSKEE